MKILHAVENYFPSTGGMQEVVRQLSERLAAAGHDVTVATKRSTKRDFKTLNGVKIEEFSITGNFAGGMLGEVDRYRDYLVQSDFDIVTFFAAQQFATDAALKVLPQIKAKKVSVPTGYSGLYQPHYRDYYEKMRAWIRYYDMNVYLSEDYRDINFAKQNGVKKYVIIPNGADEREFNASVQIDVRERFSIPADNKIILHVGSYTGHKGHKEALNIFLESDLKNSTLLMIGDNLGYFRKRSILKYPALLLKWQLSRPGSKQVIMGSADRKTTVAAFKTADLFFFPSLIECSPIVLFEAAAAGLPFLSSSAGNSAEIAKWTGGGLIMSGKKNDVGFWSPNVKEAARELTDLLHNDAKRKQMGESAHKAWEEKFTWEKIAKQYEELYLKLLAK